MSKFFGGKDPFDDPFFTHPFGGMFHTQSDSLNRSKEITIEELDSDGKPMNHSELSKEVVSKNPSGKNANWTKSFSYQRVAYGGLNGMYYTASVTRKSGNGGVVMMEINEEDKTVGQAQNTISRGIQDKGHSVSTKHTSDGKVDTLHTLHNLNEDELAGFEETWKANEQILPSDWNSSFNLLENADSSDKWWNWWPTWSGWALPPTEHSADAGANLPQLEAGTSSRGRAKKTVPVNVE
ncbi:glycine-rich protein [Actinidia rufa]|uniref:Glycine-rich protein n=1 Tax=Actinidia rufa TaxID=165716 RepID=A0A7J0F190_9ERIC|nr:glycine-rich protein [Actinidia rufa]